MLDSLYIYLLNSLVTQRHTQTFSPYCMASLYRFHSITLRYGNHTDKYFDVVGRYMAYTYSSKCHTSVTDTFTARPRVSFMRLI